MHLKKTSTTSLHICAFVVFSLWLILPISFKVKDVMYSSKQALKQVFLFQDRAESPIESSTDSSSVCGNDNEENGHEGDPDQVTNSTEVSRLTLYVLHFQRKQKHTFTFFVIPPH